MLSADDIKNILNLRQHQDEGGHFRETYRSEHVIDKKSLPERYGSSKAISTAIYYLLTPDTCSLLHRLPTDEIYHFYLGDPVCMLLLKPDGISETVILGQDIAGGQQVQFTIPAGTWQGSYLLPGGRFALMGTTMAPAYDPPDFESADRDSLITQYPDNKDLIIKLTAATP